MDTKRVVKPLTIKECIDKGATYIIIKGDKVVSPTRAELKRGNCGR